MVPTNKTVDKDRQIEKLVDTVRSLLWHMRHDHWGPSGMQHNAMKCPQCFAIAEAEKTLRSIQ